MGKKIKENISLILGEAPHERKFFCANGQVISSLDELQKALSQMPDPVFNHHVNKEKNDFYNWVKDVFRDSVLASSIKKLKVSNPQQLSKVIRNRLEKLREN